MQCLRLLRHSGALSSVSRSSADWQGRISEDAWLSTLAFPESIQELQRFDKTNYQLDITKLGVKHLYMYEKNCGDDQLAA
jgi:hypothetical protein